MIRLQKKPGKDFVVLNITDTQLDNAEWGDGHVNRQILEYTVTELIKRTQPDLITVSGDLAWAGNEHAYKMLALFLESFNIPWAPIWGNHDNQGGAEIIEKVANEYLTMPHCVYEKGDPAFGNGNYVIGIEENGKLVEAIFMLDSHDREKCVDENGTEQVFWAKLTKAQIAWYKEQADALKAKGCKDSTIILHIPIYAYRLAAGAAYKASIERKEVTIEQADGTECWNDGYTDSVGVQHEAISSHEFEDGVFEVIKEKAFTKHVVAGHDHVNNFMISYEGVKLIFALKTGAGCYWEPTLNGGTVLKINSDGVYNVAHEYVDISQIINK